MIKTKHLGSWGEITAAAWLMKQGYTVYQNISDHGMIDLIALKDKELLKIDVKIVSARMAKDGSCIPRMQGGSLKLYQHHAGVIPLFVLRSGACSFIREELSGFCEDEDFI